MTWKVLRGDCLEEMDKMPPGSVDAIVCDPPYELAFLGKAWDATGISFRKETWQAAFRVLKPGGHLLAFAGSRTYHRIAVAIEDAGFEVRDMINYCYGNGFPKSKDISKAIDESKGLLEQRKRVPTTGGMMGGSGHNIQFDGDGLQYAGEPVSPEAKKWQGRGTQLKPSHEPIVVARKPCDGSTFQNVLDHGTGAMNIDATRVVGDPWDRKTTMFKFRSGGSFIKQDSVDDVPQEMNDNGRWPPNVLLDTKAAKEMDTQSDETT